MLRKKKKRGEKRMLEYNRRVSAKKKRKKECNRRENDLQVYGVYSVSRMRNLILNEQEVIRPRLGPIEPSFMKMRLQSPCFMDLRHKHVPWTKLAKRHTKNFDKRRKNWPRQWVVQVTTQPNFIPIFCFLSCAKFYTTW